MIQGMNPVTIVRVKTVRSNPANDREYTAEANRRWGVKGTLVQYSNSHGLCFQVRHDDGSLGAYEPDELRLIDPESRPRSQKPT